LHVQGIGKNLSNRFKKALPNVIDCRQSVIISGRSLLHSALITNEAMEEAIRGKKRCLIFKVDFEKILDSVS